MYKRLVSDALRAGAVRANAIVGYTDEGLLAHLGRTAPAPLLGALLGRRLYKRALECPAAELAGGAAEWIATDPALAVAVEDFLAERAGLARGELLLDYPTKTQNARAGHPRAAPVGRHRTPHIREPDRVDQPALTLRRVVSVGAMAACVRRAPHDVAGGGCTRAAVATGKRRAGCHLALMHRAGCPALPRLRYSATVRLDGARPGRPRMHPACRCRPRPAETGPLTSATGRG